MSALTDGAYSVLSGLAAQLGLKPVWSTSSGDAGSDVNGWLAYTLADANQSAAMVALREQVRLALGMNVTPGAKVLFDYYRLLIDGTAPAPVNVSPLAWFDGRSQAYSDLAGTVPQNTVGGLVGVVNESSPLAGRWLAPSTAQRVAHDAAGVRIDLGGTSSPGTTLQRLAAASVPLSSSTLVFNYIDRDGIGGPLQGFCGAFPTLWGAQTGGGALSAYINGSAVASGLTIPRAQKCTVAIRWTATTVSIWLLTGGILTKVNLAATVTPGTTGSSGIALAFANAGTQGGYFSTSQVMAIGRACTDGEMASQMAWVSSQPLPSGYPLTAPLIGVCGDSIARAGVGVNSNDGWCWVMLQNLRAGTVPTAEVCNVAIVGSGVAPAMYSALTPFYSASRAKNVTFLAGATNDLANGNTAAATATAYFAACDALRSQGWKVVACTVLPRSDTMVVSQAAFNAARATLNASILAGSGHYDAIADVAAVVGMGADGDSNNVTNYSADKVHPNGTGHRLIEPTYRAAVLPLL